MNRSQELKEKFDDVLPSAKAKRPVREKNLDEKINRIPVNKAVDMNKVAKMATNFPKAFADQWNVLRTAKQTMADLLFSMNNSFREVRLFLEDNFTNDPKDMENLSPELKKAVTDLDVMVDDLDTEYNGIASAVGSPTTGIGSGALKRQVEALDKKRAAAIEQIKKVQDMLKKEKVKA